jgi:molybdate transport system ATP-binding protein
VSGIEVDLVATRGPFRLEAKFVAPTPGVVALYGPSGAGKSTLVNAIAGLVAATGSIRIDEETWLDSAAGRDLAAEHRGVGYVFQDARLFPHLDVAGNLAYGERRAAGRRRITTRAEVIDLLGLGTLLGRRHHQLSGGERQRVALGRALLAQPRLLLLDEPLASIDAARREEVLPYLLRLRDTARIPMLYVSHQYEEVLRLATHLVLVDAGRVVASGTPAALSAAATLRRMVGPDGVGTVLETEVAEVDAASGLVSLAVGAGRLRLPCPGAALGDRLRLHILARDVIVAIEEPRGLSVRNALPAVLCGLEDESAEDVLAMLEIGSVTVMARITRAAVRELRLAPGMPVWGLVKAASLRGHASAHRPATAGGHVAPSTPF